MKSKFGLSDEKIDEIVENLSQILADHHILYVATLNSHWNVEDARFMMLHEFFEKNYTQLAEQTDQIAERIRMLGRETPASLKAFLERGTLEEITVNLSANEMIEALAISHEKMIQSLRRIISRCDELKDPGTSNMLTDMLEVHEKTAWFLRSHL